MGIKIPIKKYVMDETLSWEERYKQLEAHHAEETLWMLGELNKRESVITAAVEMQRRRGWAFTVRDDLHGEEWSEIEKIVKEFAEKGS